MSEWSNTDNARWLLGGRETEREERARKRNVGCAQVVQNKRAC